jgi:hypothetical protein
MWKPVAALEIDRLKLNQLPTPEAGGAAETAPAPETDTEMRTPDYGVRLRFETVQI